MSRERDDEVVGRVHKGVVVFAAPMSLPEGTVVTVRPCPRRRGKGAGGRPKSLYELLKPVIGKAKGLPPDFSVNHDHYLYGTPKRT